MGHKIALSRSFRQVSLRRVFIFGQRPLGGGTIVQSLLPREVRHAALILEPLEPKGTEPLSLPPHVCTRLHHRSTAGRVLAGRGLRLLVAAAALCQVVPGDVLASIKATEQVIFVMKGGQVYRSDKK
jgi:hypothetical protein